MKKKMATLLATVLCVGVFSACDKDEADGKVTEEQWTTAFTSPDLTNFVAEIEHAYETGIVWKQRVVVNGNNLKAYDRNERIDSAGETEVEEETNYLTEIDGVSYEYDDNDVVGDDDDPTWRACYTATEFSDFKYNFTMTLSSMITAAQQSGLAGFTYDKDEGFYYFEATDPVSGGGTRMEVEFKDDVLYAIRQVGSIELMEEGVLVKQEIKSTYIFTVEEIVLPDLAGLNALIAGSANQE